MDASVVEPNQKGLGPAAPPLPPTADIRERVARAHPFVLDHERVGSDARSRVPVAERPRPHPPEANAVKLRPALATAIGIARVTAALAQVATFAQVAMPRRLDVRIIRDG